jgi:hypothetical protein
MSMRPIRVVAILGALTASLAVPMLAHACSVVFAPTAPLPIQLSDLRFGSSHESTRAQWNLADDWVASRPYLDQRVARVDGWRVTAPVRASFRQQRTLTVAAAWRDNGATAMNDSDPTTPDCAIAGQHTWSPPMFLVRETARAITITSVSRPAKGSRVGCVSVADSCGDTRSVTFRLKAPVGDRRIYRSKFA